MLIMRPSVAAQERREVPLHRGEELHVQHGLVAVVGVLDEREVRVRPAVRQPVDLAADPDPVREAPAQLIVDRLGQLGDSEGGVRGVVELGVAEVERGLAHAVDSIRR